jgi:hypothetical protein
MNKYEQYPSFLRIEPPLCINQIIKAFVDLTCSRLSYLVLDLLDSEKDIFANVELFHWCRIDNKLI